MLSAPVTVESLAASGPASASGRAKASGPPPVVSRVVPSSPLLGRPLPIPTVGRTRDEVVPDSLLLGRPLAPSFGEIVGTTPVMQQLLARLAQVAPLTTPVLITGEPGTGKHLLAHALHQLARRRGPLLTVDAVGLPTEDLMLQLYGQERRGADDVRDITPGLLDRARGGTLVFEDVAQLDARGQRCVHKLLTETTYARRGSLELRPVEVRVIVMTSQPLLELVRRGEFCDALFHHLAPTWLAVPPLRQRRDDIPQLAAAFLAHDAPPHPRGPTELPTATLLRLLGYAWPGNVRELREVLRQAALQRRECATRPARRPEISPENIAPLLASTRAPSEARFKIGTPLAAVQREVILMTLAAVDGNKKDAAELLGLSRGALYSRLRSYSAQARALWRAAQQRSLATVAASSSGPSPAARAPRKSDSPPGTAAVKPVCGSSVPPRPDAQAEVPAQAQPKPKAQPEPRAAPRSAPRAARIQPRRAAPPRHRQRG